MTTTGKPPQKSAAARADAELRAYAMTLPETREDHPWGHSAYKAGGKKAFAFASTDGGGFSVSVKLPESRYQALELPFCEPTHYGLGKSGWVTASFGPHLSPPMELVKRWVEESYRAIAPKKLIARLDGAVPTVSAPKKIAARRATAKRPAKRK